MIKRTRVYRRIKTDAGLQAAIISIGGVTNLAKALKIKHPAVSRWRRTPAERVRTVSRLTGIPCHVLRPDLYDPPAQGNAA